MNPIIRCGVIAWFIAQFMKVAIHRYQQGEWRLKILLDSGGFPSSHSSFVTALSLKIGLVEGFSSSVFALSFGFWCIVLYDSFNSRYAVGEQGKLINKLQQIMSDREQVDIEPIKVILGHTPLQVAAGIGIGAAVVAIQKWVMPLL